MILKTIFRIVITHQQMHYIVHIYCFELTVCVFYNVKNVNYLEMVTSEGGHSLYVYFQEHCYGKPWLFTIIWYYSLPSRLVRLGWVCVLERGLHFRYLAMWWHEWLFWWLRWNGLLWYVETEPVFHRPSTLFKLMLKCLKYCLISIS